MNTFVRMELETNNYLLNIERKIIFNKYALRCQKVNVDICKTIVNKRHTHTYIIHTYTFQNFLNIINNRIL